MNRISSEDQEILFQLKLNAAHAAAAAQLAAAEHKTASLEHENAMLKMYLKYGLGIKDSINEATGEVRIGVSDEENTDGEGDAGTSELDNGEESHLHTS